MSANWSSCNAEAADLCTTRRRARGRMQHFYAMQNARLVKNAEAVLTARCFSRRCRLGTCVTATWRRRSTHWSRISVGNGAAAKIVVWEHNSHLGDARATDMAQRRELNVGQLVREKYGREAVLIGFTTYQGTVTAASDWGAPAERKRVRPALPGSYEAMFHSCTRCPLPALVARG